MIRSAMLPAASRKKKALLAGLLHWWKFQSDYEDAIGNNDGVVVGSLPLVSHLGRLSVRLPGVVNNWLNLPGMTLGTGPWSISTWYCPENIAGYQHLLTSDDNAEFMFKIAASSDPAAGKPYMYARSGVPGGSKFATVAVQLGVWSHLAITYEAGMLKFYVNGVLRGTIAVTMNILPKTYRVGNGPGTGEYSRGWQSDLRVYGRVLSLENIQELVATT